MLNVLAQDYVHIPSWLEGLTPLDQADLEGSECLGPDTGEEPIPWAFPERPVGMSSIPFEVLWSRMRDQRATPQARAQARAELAHRVMQSPEFLSTMERLRDVCHAAGLDTPMAFAAEAIWVSLRSCRSPRGACKYAARVLRSLVGRDRWGTPAARPIEREVVGVEDAGVEDPGISEIEEWGPLWGPLGRHGRREAVLSAIEALRGGAYGPEGETAAQAADLILSGEYDSFVAALEAVTSDGATAVAAHNAAISAVTDALDSIRDGVPEWKVEDSCYEEVAEEVARAIDRLV